MVHTRSLVASSVVQITGLKTFNRHPDTTNRVLGQMQIQSSCAVPGQRICISGTHQTLMPIRRHDRRLHLPSEGPLRITTRLGCGRSAEVDA